MRITVCLSQQKPEPWVAGLQAALPGAQVSAWQPGDPPADWAVVWAPPQAFIDEQTDLRALFNTGAGVDALLKLRLPPGLCLRLLCRRQCIASHDGCRAVHGTPTACC